MSRDMVTMKTQVMSKVKVAAQPETPITKIHIQNQPPKYHKLIKHKHI